MSTATPSVSNWGRPAPPIICSTLLRPPKGGHTKHGITSVTQQARGSRGRHGNHSVPTSLLLSTANPIRHVRPWPHSGCPTERLVPLMTTESDLEGRLPWPVLRSVQITCQHPGSFERESSMQPSAVAACAITSREMQLAECTVTMLPHAIDHLASSLAADNWRA